MKHITFDLETLGNTSNAPVIQIGAVVFDESGKIYDKFNIACDIDTIPQDKFHVDYSTLKWWMEQIASNKELIEVFRGKEEHYDMLRKFYQWVLDMKFKYNDLVFWSHATFDPPIINNNFKAVNMANPMYFRLQRDIRTLTHIAGYIEVKQSKGNAHNALDDAIYQAAYISKGLRILKEKGLVF